MKILIKAAFTIILATAMLSCAKENQEVAVQNNNATIDVCIDGTIEGYSAQEETKASTETVIRIRWAGGETVYVYDGVTPIGSLTASIEGTDGTYAKLSGTITAPSGTKPITLIYSPQFSGTPAVSDGKISLDLSLQDETEVPFLIYGVLPTTAASAINDAVVKFVLATSVYKCNCSCLPEGELSQAVIGELNTVCELNLSDSAEPEVGASRPEKITRTSGFTTSDSDHRAIFSVALARTDASAGRSIEVVKGGKVYEAAFSKTAFGAGKAYNAVFMFSDIIPAGALSGKFTVADPDGIPGSGDEKQVYFSRGNLYWDGYAKCFKLETEQYYSEMHITGGVWDKYRVNLLFWNTAAYMSSSYAGSYTPEDERKDTDVLFTNSTKDTPNPDFSVYVDGNQHKGIWRTMSIEECNYLIGHHARAEATINGFYGTIVFCDGYTESTTGTFSEIPEGCIFLPACGYRRNTEIMGLSGNYIHSDYWLSTASDRVYAYVFYADIRTYNTGYDNRRDAKSIRLVMDCDVVIPDGISVRYGDDKTMLISEMNYGAGSLEDKGSLITQESLQSMKFDDGWALPTKEDMLCLNAISHHETEAGTQWNIDGKTLIIPYTKEVEIKDDASNIVKAWESRLWLADKENYFFFRSDGISGYAPASGVARQEFCVRLVKHLN